MSVESFAEIYCIEQINIPVTFPHILKSFAKAAIRTQPYDLLHWTSAYFRALANGEVPPIKKRFEHPPFTHPTGLTPRYLKTLLNQLGRTNTSTNTVTLKTLLDCWQSIILPETVLYQILMIGHLLNNDKHHILDLYHFLAVACGLISNNLLETMIKICELLTDEPDGGSAMIPLKTFLNLYGYLAKLNCSREQFSVENLSSQNFDMSSKSSDIIESSLFDNKKFFFTNHLISTGDSKSVCTYESNERFCELISDESSEYCATIVTDDKTNDGNIKFIDDVNVNKITTTMKKYGPAIYNETSMKEVTRVQNESCDEIDDQFDDTVVAVASMNEHITMNKNHVNSSDLSGSPLTLDNLTTSKVTSEIPEVDIATDEMKSNSSINVIENLASPFQVSGDVVIDGESNADIRDNEKVMMVAEEMNKFEKVKKSIKSIAVDMMEKQKQQRQKQKQYEIELNVKDIVKETCECQEKSEKKMATMTIMKENESGRVQLQMNDEKTSGMISQDDKVAEFIRKMKVKNPPYINYSVAGIGDVVSDERITNVGLWLTECARLQGGHVGTRNLRHFLCPSLHDNNDDDNTANNSCGVETN